MYTCEMGILAYEKAESWLSGEEEEGGEERGTGSDRQS